MLFPTVKPAVDKLPASCACMFNRVNFFHISGLGFDGAALALLFQGFVSGFSYFQILLETLIEKIVQPPLSRNKTRNFEGTSAVWSFSC